MLVVALLGLPARWSAAQEEPAATPDAAARPVDAAEAETPVREPPAVPRIETGTEAEAGTEAETEAETGTEAESGTETESGDRLEGTFFTRARARHANRDADQDVLSGLSVRLTLHPGVELYGQTDFFVDAGRHDASGENHLGDLWDTRDDSLIARVHEAYVRFDGVGVEGLEVRLGRQTQWQTHTVSFDGAWASLSIGEHVTLRALGGVPVWWYDSSPRGDVVAGGGVDLDFAVLGTTRVSLDYLHVTEDDPDRAGFEHDNLFTVAVRQQVGPLAVRAKLDVLDERLRSSEASATLRLAPADVVVRGNYRVLFQRQQGLTNELDPYTRALSPEEPHHSFEASVWKGFAAVVGVELTYALRRVIDGEEEDRSNRNFHRYGATLHVYDLPWDGLHASLTGLWWDVLDGGNDVQGVSGEVEYRPLDALHVSAGSSYSLYAYDEQTGRHREDVRIYFARVRTRWREHRLEVEYAFEDDDLDDFHTVTLWYRHDF